jgi:putative redox protein
MKSEVTLKEEMHFNAELENFNFSIDADAQFGGTNQGPKPKGLVLTALAGCTAMDVISILRKMRLNPSSFSVGASAELTEHHPKIFKEILITYTVSGDKITEDKVKKAVDLSLDNYCGVSEMLKKATTINYKIIIKSL